MKRLAVIFCAALCTLIAPASAPAVGTKIPGDNASTPTLTASRVRVISRDTDSRERTPKLAPRHQLAAGKRISGAHALVAGVGAGSLANEHGAPKHVGSSARVDSPSDRSAHRPADRRTNSLSERSSPKRQTNSDSSAPASSATPSQPAGGKQANATTPITNGEAANNTMPVTDGPSFTGELAGRRMSVFDALEAAADAVNNSDTPYVYGGGHQAAGVASTGDVGRGNGADGVNVGFDCSGSVAAVLAGAGLWPAGSPVPGDDGIIAQLLQEGLIAPGPGSGPEEVTLYDNPGVHIFMNIGGRFFGTSDGDGGSGTSNGGAGWLDDSAPDASSPAFIAYHVLPSELASQLVYGQTPATPSQTPAPAFASNAVGVDESGLRGGRIGNTVRRRWQNAVKTAGETGYRLAALGTMTVVAADRSSFAVDTCNGQTLTFAAAGRERVPGDLQASDVVFVTYTKTKAGLTARGVTLVARPLTGQATGTIVAVAADGSSFTIRAVGDQELTFSTGGADVLNGLGVYDIVTVSYTQPALSYTQPSSGVTAPQDVAAQETEAAYAQGTGASDSAFTAGASAEIGWFDVAPVDSLATTFSSADGVNVIDCSGAGAEAPSGQSAASSLSSMTAVEVQRLRACGVERLAAGIY